MVGHIVDSQYPDAAEAADPVPEQLAQPGEHPALQADLGGAARMSRFVTLFTIGVVPCLGVVLSVVFGAQFGPGIWIAPSRDIQAWRKTPCLSSTCPVS